MPLLRYFGFAGSALVLLLFGLNWFVAPPVAEPIRSGIDRSVIRISSVEKLPERVDIDSSLPTIVPAPTGSPRILSKYIAEELGKGKGLLASRMAAMDTSGIRYVPQYVLTQDQVDAVGRGALSMIDKLNGIR